MSERTLLRKLQRTPINGCVPAGYPQPWTPQDEQDARRERLAEELLKILAEEVVGYDEGETIETGRLVEQMQVAAEAALAAAEKVYPELPEPGAGTP